LGAKSLLNAKFRLAILGNPAGWYVRDLRRAASALDNIEIDVVSFRDLRVESHLKDSMHVYSKRYLSDACSPATSMKPDASDIDSLVCRLDGNFDAILVRSMPLGSLEQVIFRMNVLHVAQQLGIAIFNPPRTLEVAIDKWLTLDVARQAGVEVPRTICCQDRESALQAFEQLHQDVVVKPLFGGEGRGLVRVNDREMAWRVFSTLEQIGAVIYVQEFIQHSGFDLRILIIGNETYCVARHTADDDWRTNLSRGGFAEKVQPTEQQLAMAKAAALAVGGKIVGVDILPTRDGRDVLLEINAVPGWRGTAKALDTDIAEKVLQFVRR
jgi:tetrahydromethanopterin:alpha-L-glutamate ligase